MKSRLVAALWALSLAGLGCAGEATKTDSSGPGVASPKQAVQAAALVIDVRTPEEFATGHLDQATNIPVDQIEAQAEAIAGKVGGDKSKSIVLYCGSGARAGRAKSTLEKAGFTNVTNAGGYKDLK